MYLPIALLLLLVSQGLPLASALAPHKSLSRATERLHSFAKRKSAGLARDLRVIFQGLSVDTVESDSSSSHRVYCVRPDPFSAADGNSTSPANASPSGTASSPASTATSAFKLVEEHVSSKYFVIASSRLDNRSPGVTSLMDGPFGI